MAENFTQISDPSVTVNDITVNVAPNSVKYKSGKGEKNVKIQSAGNGNVTTVVSTDISTAKGMVSFEVQSTTQSILLKEQWQAVNGGNVIEIDSVNLTMTNSTMVNDPEINLTDDGTVEVVFEGSALV